jgi:hypothetical protein
VSIGAVIIIVGAIVISKRRSAGVITDEPSAPGPSAPAETPTPAAT